ncbi:unnamed protein product [Lampetra fluviatilis]
MARTGASQGWCITEATGVKAQPLKVPARFPLPAGERRSGEGDLAYSSTRRPWHPLTPTCTASDLAPTPCINIARMAWLCIPTRVFGSTLHIHRSLSPLPQSASVIVSVIVSVIASVSVRDFVVSVPISSPLNPTE